MKNFTFKQYCTVTLIAIVTMSGCGKQDKLDESTVGDYVYVDRYGCIHVKQRCVNLFLSGGENGEEPRYMVDRVEIKSLRTIGKTCSSCVTDDAYKELERRIGNN